MNNLEITYQVEVAFKSGLGTKTYRFYTKSEAIESARTRIGKSIESVDFSNSSLTKYKNGVVVSSRNLKRSDIE